MLANVRFILPAVILALLAGCASQTPLPPEPEPVPEAVQVEVPVSHEVLFRALALVGTPYRYGGNTPETGFDCSGLIGYVYRDAAGIVLPRSTREMIRMPARAVERNALQPGDLVFFATAGGRRVSHAGIYVGEGRFVHAPSSGGVVRLDQLSDRYWQKSYLSAKRVLDNDDLAQNP